jgi:hypothetical protein
MKYPVFLCLAAALLVSGCDTLSVKERQKLFTDENDAYIGKTYDELVKGKGVPTGTATLSDGSKVVEYYNAQVEITGGGTYAFPAATYVQNTHGGTWVYMQPVQSMPVRSWNKICKIDFIVSPKNTVESWKYDGKGCY